MGHRKDRARDPASRAVSGPRTVGRRAEKIPYTPRNFAHWRGSRCHAAARRLLRRLRSRQAQVQLRGRGAVQEVFAVLGSPRRYKMKQVRKGSRVP